MPSSLIIVALAAAWLVVLVPMVARRRQAVARTTDAALAARVVRSGGGSDEEEEEFAMHEQGFDDADSEYDESDYADSDYDGDFRSDHFSADGERRYRPGRGGFDPEAAEIAARAKYAFRQRVVVGLIVLSVLTAVAAGFVLPAVWWLHGLVDVSLVGYLVYLRRQVRIEEEIRQRRMARMNSTRMRRPMPRRRPEVEPEEQAEYGEYGDYEVSEEPRRELVYVERRPSPASRLKGHAVVVDVEDEDPAFHELDDPGQLPFRRAVGE